MLSWPRITLLLAIIISFIGLFILVKKWPGKPTMTFSQHAAQYRASRLFFAALWLVNTPLFFWFLVLWFPGEFGMPPVFTATAFLMCVGILVAGLVPETTGWKVKVHRFAAFGMATLMAPILGMIAVYGDVPIHIRLIVGVATIYLVYEILILVKNKGQHPNMLVHQCLYIAVYHTAILSATFL
jgi:hypothetical protein